MPRRQTPEPRRARDVGDARADPTSRGQEMREPRHSRGTPPPDDMALEGHARVLLDTIPTLVWQASADGSAEFFNRRWLEYTGLSPDEARGWKWSVAIHPDDQKQLMQTWQAILQAGQPGEAEARLRGADGQYRWFLFRCVPLRDENGRITGWCGTNTDIEDRKRIEDDLCRSKAILDETQRLTRCGSMGLNISTGEVFWSAEGARIFGFDPQDRPTVELIWQRIHPDDRWLSERSVERARRGEPDTEYDVRLVMPDGSIRYVRRIDPPGGSELGSRLCVRGHRRDRGQGGGGSIARGAGRTRPHHPGDYPWRTSRLDRARSSSTACCDCNQRRSFSALAPAARNRTSRKCAKVWSA